VKLSSQSDAHPTDDTPGTGDGGAFPLDVCCRIADSGGAFHILAPAVLIALLAASRGA
jgi:hypothetical protein